jgi:hypothetical protein
MPFSMNEVFVCMFTQQPLTLFISISELQAVGREGGGEEGEWGAARQERNKSAASVF